MFTDHTYKLMINGSLVIPALLCSGPQVMIKWAMIRDDTKDIINLASLITNHHCICTETEETLVVQNGM
jgi:hypothetical protein